MRWLKILLVAVVLIAGFGLRFRYYDQVPHPGDSLDEYSFSWLGLSLVQIGTPVAAIGVGGYDNTLYRYINVDRIFQSGKYVSPVKINFPWFDHPPLMGLLTGGYAYISGVRIFEDTTIYIIRKPMVILGVVAIALVMLVGWQYFGYWPAIIGGLIYATSPLVVVSSRMVQAENLLVIWFLMIIWLLKKFEDDKKIILWLIVGVFFGLAIWTKFSALAILPVILWRIKTLEFKYFLMGFIPLLIWLGIYVGVFGAQTFFGVNIANTSREYSLGAHSIYELITKQRVTHTKFMTDGFVVIAWWGLAATIWVSKKMDNLQVYIASYLGTYILFGNYPHGWYATPLWPVLFILLGKYIYYGITSFSKIWLLIITLLVPLGVALERLLPYPKFSEMVPVWRWGLFGILMILIVLNSTNSKNKFLKVLAVLIFVLAVFTNAYWVGNLGSEQWYKIY